MADLDPQVVEWIEDVTGGVIDSVVAMGGGGRVGYGIDVTVDAQPRRLFLQKGRGENVGSFLPIAREAEVVRALEPLGIPVPHVWGVDPALGLALVDRADGVTWFH